jgi:hypothetical protein
MRLKANSTFCIGRSAAPYHSRAILYSGNYKKRNRASVMNMEFRRDDVGGRGGVFVK